MVSYGRELWLKTSSLNVTKSIHVLSLPAMGSRFLSCNTMLCTDSSQVPVHRAPWPHVTSSTFGTSVLSLSGLFSPWTPPQPHSQCRLWNLRQIPVGFCCSNFRNRCHKANRTEISTFPPPFCRAGVLSYTSRTDQTWQDMLNHELVKNCFSIQTSVLRRASFDKRIESVNSNFLNISSHQGTKCL